jgi:hypothetical protein
MDIVGFGYCWLGFLVSEKMVQAGTKLIQKDACVGATATAQSATAQTSAAGFGAKYYPFRLHSKIALILHSNVVH